MDYFEIRKIMEEYIKEKGVRVGLQDILDILYGIVGEKEYVKKLNKKGEKKNGD